MNLRLLSRLLGILAMLIGGMMVFSLPWAFAPLGKRKTIDPIQSVEWDGLLALTGSMLVCFLVGGLLIWLGRQTTGPLFRKEAMAVVGLSWILATILGALPFYLAGVRYISAVRLFSAGQRAQIKQRVAWRRDWRTVDPLSGEQFQAVRSLVDAGARGLDEPQLRSQSELDHPGQVLRQLADADPLWAGVLLFPEEGAAAATRQSRYRLRWVRMGLVDCLFESQSGFSTTGATVISDLEDPELVPHCILFWRSSTHFLGGLGIIVLFVVILGQGSAGKALMCAEMPGPTKEGSTARMQHTAWLFTGIYCGLNLVLAAILMLCGMSLFDAVCHAFGTMATGGFSTYNASVGHFDSVLIDAVIVVFMVLAGTNFTLLFFLLVKARPGRLLADAEWRTYMMLIAGVTLLIVVLGLMAQDFSHPGTALRKASFQVVSILTTTGYGTADFDQWNSFARAVLLILMFIGGCAGSTGGGMKVIRHLVFVKVVLRDIERSYRPRVVRLLRVGGRAVDDPDLDHNILLYFSLILIIFIPSWLAVVTIEPSTTWGVTQVQEAQKLLDTASAIAATLNNIGPGLGIVGATNNYAYFSPINKILFVWLMMLGRLEIFSILVLFVPGFWRDR